MSRDRPRPLGSGEANEAASWREAPLAGIQKARDRRIYDVERVEARIAATLAAPHQPGFRLAVPEGPVVQQPALVEYDRLQVAQAGVTA